MFEHVAESLSHENTVAGFIAGVLILLSLHLILGIIKMVISVMKSVRENDGKKIEKLATSLESNTRALHELTTQLKGHEQRLVDTDKEAIKLEARHLKLVAIVRELAGDRWAEFQKRVKDDPFLE